jgi:ferric-dicitrate binding protein FerR (iron transport regulator)
MPSKDIDRQLLQLYIEGNCSTDQLNLIKEYLTDEAYRDSLHRFMQEDWEWLSNAEFPALPGMPEQYAKFRFNLARRDKGITQEGPVRSAGVRRLPVIYAVAAAVLLLIAGNWLWRTLVDKHSNQLAAQKELYFHNEPGYRTTLQLPDSSRVYLGAASTLRFKQSTDGNRLVLLEGQAYFEVRHDEQRPFTVRTGSITTVDLGTAFNIRNYAGDQNIEVAVTSGKVQVLHKGEKQLAVLDAGKRLDYDTLTQRYDVTSLANAELAGAWRKGVLTFNKQPLKEVTDELQRYYGVRFQYSNPSAENILITTVLDNKTLEDALDIVTLTAGIQFTRQGTRIVLK